MDSPSLELDPILEPQFRARSNTWPLPRAEEYTAATVAVSAAAAVGDVPQEDKMVPSLDHPGGLLDSSGLLDPQGGLLHEAGNPSAVPPKKNAARRNAWGNMSYAELITRAIQSSPEGRLTLSQIYEWMVQNVSYFKDKGDNNSSAGWKNSIRHNLSLHNRFMRVQNEGTGKSSWWVINPDAKPGKCPRRRAGSMDTQKMEKKRGRVKKKMEALRNGTEVTSSPGSSVSENLDMFPDSPPVHHGYQLSPECRPRASSNASSCSRLSPIPAAETDLHESQVSPGSIPWHSPEPPSKPLASLYAGATSHGSAAETYSPEQLATMAETLKLGGSSSLDSGYRDDYDIKPNINGQSPPRVTTNGLLTLNYQNYGTATHEYKPYSTPPNSERNTPPLPSLSTLQPQQSLVEQGGGYHLPSHHTVSPPPQVNTYSPLSLSRAHAAGLAPHRLAISNEMARLQSLATPTSLGCTAGHVRGQVFAFNNAPLPMMPNDVDFDTVQGGLECDVNQVIHYELSVEGNLDFNFDGSNLNTARPWVH